MKELPISIQEKLERYQPIKKGGYTLYPVRVADYRRFSVARPALEFAQQSLPVALLSVPLLDAFYKLELQNHSENREPSGFFASAVTALELALRLGDGEEADGGEEIRALPIPGKTNDTLKEILFLRGQEQIASVTPQKFQSLRPIIAAQNGIQIPDEEANPEILEMERLMEQNERANLEPKMWEKIVYVSQGSGIQEEEIYDWPLLKLERHAAILQRTTDYLAAQLAALSGMVKFKDGNPVPSPYFGRQKSGLRSLRDLQSPESGVDAAARDHQDTQSKE